MVVVLFGACTVACEATRRSELGDARWASGMRLPIGASDRARVHLEIELALTYTAPLQPSLNFPITLHFLAVTRITVYNNPHIPTSPMLD
jgi:hypothetical protein